MAHLNSGYVDSLHRQIYASVEKIKNQPSSQRFLTESETPDLRQQVRNYAYRVLNEEISWTLQQTEISGSANYAAGSYRQAGEILRPPTVLIDLMFKNNREFDFKV